MKLPDHLPPLRGWSFQIYRVLWALLLVAAIATLLLSYPAQIRYQAADRAEYAAGVWIDQSSSAGSPITPLSDEARAQLRDGDVVVAVDGRPAPTNEMLWAETLTGPEGRLIHMTIRHGDGSLAVIALHLDNGRADRLYASSGIGFGIKHWAQWGILQAANLLVLATGALLFFRRPHDPVAALVALVGPLLCIDPWTLWARPPLILVYGSQAAVNFAVVMAILAFPTGHIRARITRATLAGAILMTVLQMMEYWPGGAALKPLFIASGVVTLVLLVLTVIRNFRAIPPGPQRQQMKFALLGFIGTCLFTLLSVVAGLMQNRAFGTASGPWLSLASDLFGALGQTCFAGGLLVSLLRFRLYDADALISRSAAYAALTLMLGAAFAACEQVIEVFGEQFFGEGSKATAAGIAAAVAAMLIAPAHNRVHRWTEQRFQRALAKFRRDLPETVNDMREFASLDQLLAAVASQLEQGVRASRAAILLGEGFEPLRIALTRHTQVGEVEDWMKSWAPSHNDNLQCEREDAVFPLRLRLHATGAATIGWVLLGPRPDGSFFGKDEREALAGVADPVARAIHIVRQRDARETRLTGRIGVLEGEVARLVRLLKSVGAASPA